MPKRVAPLNALQLRRINPNPEKTTELVDGAIQCLREELGRERHLVIVIMLKKHEDPEMLAPAVREAIAFVVNCTDLTKVAVSVGLTDRDAIRGCRELDGLEHRMLFYANKPSELQRLFA